MDRDTNLVWIDTEFTGVDAIEPRLIEVSLLITDKNLEVVNEGLDMVIYQSETVLDSMSDWCKQHSDPVLMNMVKNSKITEKEAEVVFLEEIKKYCNPKMSLLCGNSLWWDKYLMIRYMPQIIDHLHYRIIDVSTIKELYRRWYPTMPEFVKSKKHRALDDILESVAELKFYRETIFR